MNFRGTDTLSGVMTAKRYYGAEMAGFSIPAAEHRYVHIATRTSPATLTIVCSNVILSYHQMYAQVLAIR